MSKGMIYFFLVMLSMSCSAQRNLIGNYSKAEKDFKYTLQLNADSTFVLSQKYFEVNSKCNGKWKILSNDEILLKCSEITDVAETLAGGYMSEREKKVIVLSGNKLKLGQVTLKKTRK